MLAVFRVERSHATGNREQLAIARNERD